MTMTCSAIRKPILSFLLMLSASLSFLFSTPVFADTSAVVIMYHRFDDDRYPTTNITMEQFDAHITELQKGAYTVAPITEILEKQARGEDLINRTIGISIDDAYLSVYEKAWPILREANLHFTLFVSTDAVDRGLADMMSWDQIRELQAAGITIAAHTRTHLHMPRHSLLRTKQEITHSTKRFEDELGVTPTIFAYPYGETSSNTMAQVKAGGYKAAFGQHSGAFNHAYDPYNLPRFSLNEKYGDMGRFKTAVNAMALPLTDITPESPLITKGDTNPPALGFTINGEVKRLDQLGCFLSHEGKANVMNLGDIRFEIRAETPFPTGRTRLNCTLPGSGDNSGRWYWFGQQYYVWP